MVYVGGGKMFVKLTSVKFIDNSQERSFALINTEQVRYIERFNRGGIDDYFCVFFGNGAGNSIILDEAIPIDENI